MEERGTVADDARIPVLVMIDVEPDGFFIDRTKKLPWTGFERAVDVMAEVRALLSRHTRRDAHFLWLVRADPQVAETYGSAGWAFEHYRRAFETFLAAGDDVGIHVHAYRWQEGAGTWVEDYGNQEWVEHCVHAGVGAFTTHFGHPPASFTMGMDWTNQATVQLVSGLNVRYELTPILAKESQPFPPRNAFTGVAPDCSRIPARPYHPSPDDFRCAAPDGGDGMWLIPQSSRMARIFPSWKRALWELVHLRPVAPRGTRKLYLEDDPVHVLPAIDGMLRRVELPYLTFAVRTDQYCRPDTTAVVRRNLEGALEHRDAGRFLYTRPDEALRVLGLVPADPR
jgi:hypothetical protein